MIKATPNGPLFVQVGDHGMIIDRDRLQIGEFADDNEIIEKVVKILTTAHSEQCMQGDPGLGDGWFIPLSGIDGRNVKSVTVTFEDVAPGCDL